MSKQQMQSQAGMSLRVVKAKHARVMLLALVSCFPALVLAYLAVVGGFKSIDQTILDYRAARQVIEPSGETVLVNVSERTLQHFGHWPIPRREIARALTSIASAKPDRVYIDFVFDTAREPAGDQALAEALAQFDKNRIAVPVSPISRATRPKADDKSQIGIADIFRDKVTLVDSSIHYSPDGLVRSLRGIKPASGQPAFDAIEWLNDSERGSSDLLDIDFSVQLDKIRQIDLLDILKGDVGGKAFAGKKIIVGSDIHGVNQLVPVPVYNFLSRTQIFALANETIALGRVADEAPLSLVILAVCLVCIAVTFMTMRLGAIGGFLFTGILGFNLISVKDHAFTSYAMQIPTAFPLVALFFSFIAGLAAAHPFFENFRLVLNGLLGRIDIRLAKVLGDGADAIVTFGEDQSILSMNSAAEKLIGKPAVQCVGEKLETILPKNGSRLVTEAAMHIPGRVETVAQCADGRLLPVDLSYNMLPTEDRWIGYVSLRDITEQKRRETELSNIAYKDSLTGLANRASFYRELARLRAGPTRSKSSALLLLDLNKFKPVNEQFGHLTGDVVLKEVARRLTLATGNSAFVARIGGDEFAILQRGTPSFRGSERLAEKIIDQIDRPVQIQDGTFHIGASIGIAHYPDHSREPEDVLKLADFAMYEAKRNGLGYCFADPVVDYDDSQTAYVN